MSPPHAAPTPPRARLRAVLVGVGLLCATAWGMLMLASLGCGRITTLKGPGEPCTRTSECQLGLTCASGVCRALEMDAGPRLDAFTPLESGVDAARSEDADLDGSLDDADLDAALEEDASAVDASDDASNLDDTDRDARAEEADAAVDDARTDDARPADPDTDP